MGRPNVASDLAAVGAVILLFAILIFGGIAGCGAYKGWQRGQRRADADNKVAITHILIRNAQQQADVVNAEVAATKAEAEKRFQEAIGIRRAQDEIQKTLTPLYVQHEAIQAQERIATSGRNNTIIYVPAGTNGTPIVTQAAKP